MDLVTDLILNKKIRKTPDIDFGVTCVNIPVHLPAPMHVHIHIHTERGSGERSSKASPSSQHSLMSLVWFTQLFWGGLEPTQESSLNTHYQF